MNGTDRASRYPYHQYHQHPYHHQYQQQRHTHHPLPPLAAAAAGTFPFSFDVDSLPTGGRTVDPAAETGGRVFATPPSSTTGATPECCYNFDEGMRRYASNGVVPAAAPASAAAAAAYLGFRYPSTCRPNVVDARFASAPIPAPEMTSQTASPADRGLLYDVKGTRMTPASDAKENGHQSNTGNISNPVTSSVRGCSDEVYALTSDDVPRHHKQLSTDDSSDDVIKNVDKIDTTTSPSRDYSRHSDRKKTNEGAEVKQEVSELHCTVRLFEFRAPCHPKRVNSKLFRKFD